MVQLGVVQQEVSMTDEMLITAVFKGERTRIFRGTLKELLANIATSYSRVPHGITREGLIYRVKVNGETVAHFTCQPLQAYKPLPGHF